MLRHASNRPIAVPLPLGGGAERPETAVDESAHYLGHRKRLRARFLEAGAQALADYELLELVLFRAIPQRDLKPLAKSLLARFGSFAEVISAPKERLAEVKGLSDAAVVGSRSCRPLRSASCAAKSGGGRCCHPGRTCSTTAAAPWPSPTGSSSASFFSTSATS